MPAINASDNCKLVTFAPSSDVVAFAAFGSAISTRRTSLHEVWTWYETALDIASLPTINAHKGR